MMASSLNRSGVPLSKLLSGWITLDSALDREIVGLSLDSRRIKPGFLFLACAGNAHHGMEYLQQALTSGAVAVLVETTNEWSAQKTEQIRERVDVPVVEFAELQAHVSAIAARFYGEPAEALSLVGVTGTNGKTSCTHYLAQTLEVDTRCGLVGTLGSGFLDGLAETEHTTPDPVSVQAQLADMRESAAEVVAMEVSSHALDQGRVAALQFDIAVLTNLSRDHLDYHQTLEEYAKAKSRLFDQAAVAVLNLDDAFGQQLRETLEGKLPVIGYSLNDLSSAGMEQFVGLKELAADNAGLLVSISSSWGEGECRVPLLGRFNASNVLAVLAVLLQSGVSFQDALERLTRIRAVSGRMERFGGVDQPTVVVDYAHTPDALEQVLLALRSHTKAKLICLFGCGGNRDKGKRPQMGAIAERLADVVVITDDNPRKEISSLIMADILMGMDRPAAVTVTANRSQAITNAIRTAHADDLVLIAGKGHENYQLVGEEKLPFSDRDMVTKVLTEQAA